MFYIRNSFGDWLMPIVDWYHNRPTYNTKQEFAGQFTEEEAATLLQHPNMHAGAYTEPVA